MTAKQFAEEHAGKKAIINELNNKNSGYELYEAIIIGYYNTPDMDELGVRILTPNVMGHGAPEIKIIKNYEHLYNNKLMRWVFLDDPTIKIKFIKTSKQELVELINKLEL